MRSLEGIKVAQFPIPDLEKSVKFNEFCTQAPTFADQQSLTRLHAFISEAVRWRPVAPNGQYKPRGFVPTVSDSRCRISPPNNERRNLGK
jgi:hypothetical protein